MARAAAPMLSGLRAATRTTRKRSNSAQTDKNTDFTTRTGKALFRIAIEQIAFSFLWSMSVIAWFQHYRLFVPLQNPVLLTVPPCWQREYICNRRNSISANLDGAKRKAHCVNAQRRKKPEKCEIVETRAKAIHVWSASG